MVTISLVRKETIHPSADSMTKKHLAPPRKELIDTVGKEMLLFRCRGGREYEEVISMDLPFVLFIPFGRGGRDASRRVPPASLQLPSRTAETLYEMVVSVQYGQSDLKKYPFPVPIARYDTLSTFGMYNRPESAERVSDHLVTLAISLPRWSYGPLDPVSVYVKLSPNQDWMGKARKVTISKITISIDEVIIYNHEGDEPQPKTKTLTKKTENVGIKLPHSGYLTNLGLVFPAKDLRDASGILPRGEKHFPMYAVTGFTTTASLYKIEYYITVRVGVPWARRQLIRLTGLTGPLGIRARHHHPPADRGLSARPCRVQRGDGSHRAGRPRRGQYEPGEPDVASAVDCAALRPQCAEPSGGGYCGQPEKAIDRLGKT